VFVVEGSILRGGQLVGENPKKIQKNCKIRKKQKKGGATLTFLYAVFCIEKISRKIEFFIVLSRIPTMLSTSAITSVLPTEIVNKILLEHYLNRYEDHAEKIDESIREIYQMGRDMIRAETFAWQERMQAQNMQRGLHMMGSYTQYSDVERVAERGRRYEREASELERKIKNARKEVAKLISERDVIESEINHFANITTDFEVRDKRMAMIRDRGLCERYE
jgi:hypothetical protein